MTIQYAIYAAPKAPDGRYRFCKEKPLLRKPFKTRKAMEAYWERRIVPVTRARPGSDYEFAMVQSRGSNWSFIGAPRYGNDTLLTGRNVTQSQDG